MIPVEEEPSASRLVPDPLEMLASVTLIRAKLPTELLAEITAEVDRPIEVKNQIAGVGSEHPGAKLAKGGHFAVLDEAVDQTVR
jgi:hypothetical protein